MAPSGTATAPGDEAHDAGAHLLAQLGGIGSCGEVAGAGVLGVVAAQLQAVYQLQGTVALGGEDEDVHGGDG
jgi:hypothetical protein